VQTPNLIELTFVDLHYLVRKDFDFQIMDKKFKGMRRGAIIPLRMILPCKMLRDAQFDGVILFSNTTIRTTGIAKPPRRLQENHQAEH
jgi:hypothetical protein